LAEANQGIGRRRTEIPGDGSHGPVEEATIPDYVMLDFADDFYPDEGANSRLRKPHTPPELFG
jgi:hypothetical protein